MGGYFSHFRKPRVLVTGCTGLLGRPLVAELAKRGMAITSVSSKPLNQLHPEVQMLFIRHSVSHYAVDLVFDTQEGKLERLQALIDSEVVDLVINLAADRGGMKWDGKKGTMNCPCLNTDLPRLLAEYSARTGMRVFHISTEYVWSGEGNTAEGYPAAAIGSDSRFVKDSLGTPYAVQKRKAEELVAATEGHSLTIFRVPVLYGYMLSSLEDGTASNAITNYLGENNASHDTWQRRYPTAAADAAAVLAAMAWKCLRPESPGLDHSVYNYGAQQCVTKYDFVKLFADSAELNRRIKSDSADKKLPDQRPPYDVRLDISAIRKELVAEGDWVEPSVLDGQTVQMVWGEHFRASKESLRAVEAIVEDLKAKMGPQLQVGVLGGRNFHSERDEEVLLTVAREMGKELNREVQLATFFDFTGAPRDFARAFGQAGGRVVKLVPERKHGVQRSETLERAYSDSFATLLEAGADLAQHSRIMRQLGDAFVTVSGGPGVVEQIEMFAEMGHPVICLQRSGARGAGDDGFPAETKECPEGVMETDWAVLTTDHDNVDEVVSAALAVMRGLAEQKKLDMKDGCEEPVGSVISQVSFNSKMVNRTRRLSLTIARKESLTGPGNEKGSPPWCTGRMSPCTALFTSSSSERISGSGT